MWNKLRAHFDGLGFEGLMERELVEKLAEINRKFYQQFAEAFAETRKSPQPGFFLLLDYLPKDRKNFLDIGCGDGRLIRFLKNNSDIGHFVGIDFSSPMLQLAQKKTDAEFHEVDLNLSGCLETFESFDVISCLATLQHIPGRQNRARLMSEISQHLCKGGRLFLSNWQFLDSPRQRKKILSWSKIGIEDRLLEESDYLITWNRGGRGYRYVAHIDLQETQSLAKRSGMQIISSFRSDGREGDLNLYTILSLQS